MRINSKGQVTIPGEIREKAGLLPNTYVNFEFDGTVVRLVPATERNGNGRGGAAGRAFAGDRYFRDNH